MKIDIPVSKADFLCDTLFVNTDVTSHLVSICVDPNLLSQIRDQQSERNMVTVYPNPAANATRFEYVLDKSSKVRLDIMALNGKIINTLVDNVQEKGHKILLWLLVDGSGNNLPDGIYFYRLTVGEKAYTGKISIIR